MHIDSKPVLPSCPNQAGYPASDNAVQGFTNAGNDPPHAVPTRNSSGQPSSDLGQPVNIPTPSSTQGAPNAEQHAQAGSPFSLPTKKVNFRPPVSNTFGRHRHYTSPTQAITIQHDHIHSGATPLVSSFCHDSQKNSY